MTESERIRMLEYPSGKIDIILDTDAATEVDDPFAIAYMLLSPERFDVKGICAAPFAMNEKTQDPAVGMEMSYEEIRLILKLTGNDGSLAHRGSTAFGAPRQSEAASFMAEEARRHSPEHPLYIGEIGAITNVASAIMMDPAVSENCVLVWLSANDFDESAHAYNIYQDVRSARIVLESGIPIINVPCNYVTSHMITSIPEMEYCFGYANPLCCHLLEIMKDYADDIYGWGKQVWDIGLIGYLIDEKNGTSVLESTPILTDNVTWSRDGSRPMLRNVKSLDRNRIFRDAFRKFRDMER